MAIAYYQTFSRADLNSQEPLESIAEKIAAGVNQRLGGKPPDGGVYHAEGPTGDDGWWVFDVWSTREACQAFRANVVGPLLAENGIVEAPGEPRWLDVWWDSSQMAGGGN